jgi:hypothetical protein
LSANGWIDTTLATSGTIIGIVGNPFPEPKEVP